MGDTLGEGSSGSLSRGLWGGWAFRAVPTPGRVWLATIRALGRGCGAAVEDMLKLPALGARGVGASMFSLHVIKRAQGAGWRFLFAPVLDVSKLPALFARGLGGGGVGSFHRAGAAL